MLRRLFFLFPDEKHAQRAVNELIFQRISERNIHAIAPGIELKTLPEATQRQKNDVAFRIENLLWNSNLLLFSIAIMTFFVSLLMAQFAWTIIALAVMAATFFCWRAFCSACA